MLRNKNTIYSEFSYLVLYADVGQHRCSLCKCCEEFSDSYPQPGGGLWATCDWQNKPESVGFSVQGGMHLPWKSLWDPHIRKDCKLPL